MSPDGVSESPPPPSPVPRLDVCGTVAVDGEPVAFGGRLLVLLVVLAVRGPRGASREELRELLWPDAVPPQGARALDPLLARLRRAVGPISGRGGHVRLDAGAVSIDVGRATAALERARGLGDPALRAAAAGEAAAILAGELAPGSTHPWVEGERDELRRRRAEALELVARAGLAPVTGALSAGESLAAARALVALLPDAEPPTALLMDLLERDGDRATAVAAYDALRRRLLDGLGLAPGPELRRRHARLLAEEDRPARPPLPEPLALTAARPLLGRDGVLEEARADLRAGRLVLLEGPPGIGKTHCAATIAQAAHADGATVLLARGTAVWPGPFGALAGALRPLVRHHDAERLRQQLGAHADDLAGVLPALAGPVAADPGGRAARDTERARVLEAIEVLLEVAGGPGGTLLVVDDAQSVDPSSLRLLAQLLTSGGVRGLKVLATARPDAASAEVLLAAAGGGLRRPLPALDAAGTAAMVARVRPELTPDAVSALAADLHLRVGGTPLLIAAALTGPGATTTLAAAVAELVAWAGEDAAPLLRCAALDDAGAGVDVLAGAAGLDLSRAERALDRAREAGLLAGGTDVVHASVREALLEGVRPAARAALHRRLAAAHEAAGGAPATIAAHWGLGVTADARARAAVWEQRAAERALDRLAAEDAVSHAERALAHLDDRDPARAIELLALCGRAHHAVSRLADGLAALREAQRRARALGRPDLVAAVAAEAPGHRLGTALNDPELVALLEEGLAAASPAQPVVRARLAARLAGMLLGGPADRRDALVAEALGLARTSGDPGAICEALMAAHTADVFRADPVARAALVDEAIALARAAGRAELALHGRMLRTSDRLEAAALDAARAELRAWDAAADVARVPYNRWAQAMARPSFDMLDGRLDRAEAQLRRADALAVALGHDPVVLASSATQWLSLMIAGGRCEEAAAGITAWVQGGATTPGWSAAVAYCSAVAGDHVTALRLLGETVGPDLAGLVDPNRAAVISFLADAAVLAHAPEPVLATLAAALAERRGTLVLQHYCGAVHGLADARAARVAAARGDGAGATRLADAAAATAGDAAPPLIALDTDYARVAALVATGAAHEAAALGEAVSARARAQGLVGLARSVDEFLAGRPAGVSRP